VNWRATRLGWDESGTSWYQIDVGIQKSEIKIKGYLVLEDLPRHSRFTLGTEVDIGTGGPSFRFHDFLNDPDVVTPSANDATAPAETPPVNEDEATDQAVGENSTPLQYTSLPEVKEKKENYKQYQPYFLHVPVEKIRKTFENTTQHATNIVSGPKIHQTIQSPYPAYNVRRRNEPVATDTIFAEVPAVDTNGMKMCQIFVGRKSLVIDVFGMHNNAEFVNTLEDVIRKRGAMDKLISDSAKVEISKRVLDIL
jgi:hypothetical protein